VEVQPSTDDTDSNHTDPFIHPDCQIRWTESDPSLQQIHTASFLRLPFLFHSNQKINNPTNCNIIVCPLFVSIGMAYVHHHFGNQWSFMKNTIMKAMPTITRTSALHMVHSTSYVPYIMLFIIHPHLRNVNVNLPETFKWLYVVDVFLDNVGPETTCR
jgi:hypothetical protein